MAIHKLALFSIIIINCLSSAYKFSNSPNTPFFLSGWTSLSSSLYSSGAFLWFQYPQCEFLQQGNALPFDWWKLNYIWLCCSVNLVVPFFPLMNQQCTNPRLFWRYVVLFLVLLPLSNLFQSIFLLWYCHLGMFSYLYYLNISISSAFL